MRIVGLDPSLRSNGVARLTLDDEGTVTGTYSDAVGRELDRGAPLAEQIARVTWCADAVLDLVAPPLGAPPDTYARSLPDLVVVEGAAFAANDPYAQERAWLRGLLYRELYALGVPLVEVAPSTLKLYAAGHGRAPKADVVKAVRRHYGHLFTIPTSKAAGAEDVADAVTLAVMGARSKGFPVDEDHPLRERAMRTPRWL